MTLEAALAAIEDAGIDRARRVGSVHAIIPAAELRPRIAEALERGMAHATSEIHKPPSPTD